MKKSILSLAIIASLAPCLPVATNAATGPCAADPQVYDLKADWSDTANPNGTWSYLVGGDFLLSNNPFPWTLLQNDLDGIIKLTEATSIPDFSPITPGYLEIGDIYVLTSSGVSLRWTAPADGTINISGTEWSGVIYAAYIYAGWTLTHNGSLLSSDNRFAFGTRSTPYNFSSGSAGPTALENISVHAGDQIEVAFLPQLYAPVGLNFTITFTPESAGGQNDAIIWHQPLARNGASEDTDPSAGRTVKYRFKRGSTIPIQIHALGCDGGDVTSNANVTGRVVVFGDSNCSGAIDGNDAPIDFNGVGGGGGVMDKIGGHLKYNLDTKSLPTTSQCYILRVTVTDTSTGEEKFEEVLLQAK